MKIYVSHSASVASAPKLAEAGLGRPENRDHEAVARAQKHGRSWFVVEPLSDPEMMERQAQSLREAGRTVIALDVEPNCGLLDYSFGHKQAVDDEDSVEPLFGDNIRRAKRALQRLRNVRV